MKFVVTIFLYVLTSPYSYCSEGLKFLSYDVNASTLDLQIVTPTVDGEVLLDKLDGTVLNSDFYFYDLFKMRVSASCKDLSRGADLLWVTKNNFIMRVSIPPMTCQTIPKGVEIVKKPDRCIIFLHGNTMWRAAVESSKNNNFTIYQNLYAIFIRNRNLFKDDDIFELRSDILLCPSNRDISSIKPEYAAQLFKEALQFQSSNKYR